MQKLFILLSVVFLSLVALPEKAEARCGSHSSISIYIGRSSCGCPIYQRRYICSYDCYGRPIYGFRSIPIVHRCGGCRRVCAPVYPRYYSPSYGYRGYYHSNYYRNYRRYRGYRHYGSKGYYNRGCSNRGWRRSF